MESKEREILTVMRKVLTSIIRDITPAPGKPLPITEQTSEDIRQCLKLIALRERELADAEGAAVEKPYYVDQPPETRVVPISNTTKSTSKDSDDD